MHNALVDFRTQTTYETATDSVVHATHLDAVANTTEKTTERELGRLRSGRRRRRRCRLRRQRRWWRRTV